MPTSKALPSPQTVVIVSGLPRSGTSMMMQMLEAGGIPVLADHERGADEDNPKGYYELEAVKATKDNADWLQRAPCKVVKMVYALLPDLPEPGSLQFKLVFMDRPLGEIIKSQKVMLERRGEPGTSLTPEKLAVVFERDVKRVFAWIAERPDFEMCRIGYRATLASPLEHAEKLNSFLGGNLNVEAMAAIVDPDLYRQRVSLSSDPKRL